LRGIGCNWLVCIAIWQAVGARDTISKIFAIWIPMSLDANDSQRRFTLSSHLLLLPPTSTAHAPAMTNDFPSTLRAAEVTQSLIKQAVSKHNDRYDKVFIKAFLAGAMLSFGGLLSEVLQ